jgi:hypothetical protein
LNVPPRRDAFRQLIALLKMPVLAFAETAEDRRRLRNLNKALRRAVRAGDQALVAQRTHALRAPISALAVTAIEAEAKAFLRAKEGEP